MLKFGEQKVSRLYLGEINIKKAYLGRDILFEASSPAPLEPHEFPYTGSVKSLMLAPGRYKFEAWGAEGGYRSGANYAGKGGYSAGTLSLSETTQVFVRAGGSGNTGGAAGGFNGGGKRSALNGGGGASDIRIGVDDLNHRVIVAGGGGSDGAANKGGGYGGGTTGQSKTDNYGSGGFGGTQTGVSDSSWQTSSPPTSTTTQSGAYAGFGFGGNGISASSGNGGAGGGGWYGGSGSMPDSSGDDDRGGGGGSGFVWTGANAPSGFGLTEEYYLANAQTKDGAQSFTSPGGTVETGHSGDGYVRITPVVSYTVTALTSDAEKGTVSGGGSYENGAQATVTATPATGYNLTGWYENGEQVSTSPAYTFTVTGNRTLTAVFVEIPVYTISATIDPSGSGSVTGTGQHQEGASVTLTASPVSGYKFVAWKENGETVSEKATYTFSATANRTLVAVFEINTSRLPDGYTEVGYIQNADTASYINTKKQISTSSIYECAFSIPTFLGSRYIISSSPGRYVLSTYSSSSGTLQIYTNNSTSGGYKVLSPAITANAKVTIKGSETSLLVNGTANTLPYKPYGATILLPASTSNNSIIVRYYYFKAEYPGSTSKTTNFELIPCINPSGVVGFYDLTNSEFIGPTAGTFISGPAV